MELLRWALVAFGLWLVSGTALSLSGHPHWYFRGWDFPRVLVAALSLACAVAYRAVLIELNLEPDARADQPPERAEEGDERAAAEMAGRQAGEGQGDARP